MEDLGPIFIKFGQLLSTRPDLIPPDICQQLDKLQDNVPPFDKAHFVAIVAKLPLKQCVLMRQCSADHGVEGIELGMKPVADPGQKIFQVLLVLEKLVNSLETTLTKETWNI